MEGCEKGVVSIKIIIFFKVLYRLFVSLTILLVRIWVECIVKRYKEIERKT